MKIYTIIVTYNAMAWIDWCLTSLRNSSVKTTVVVVDNCSTDGTREHIPSVYPEIVWIPQDHNLGFGQGNNLGIRYALENEADHVLLLNQDAAIEKDALQFMLQASDGESLVTPLMFNGDGTRFDTMFGYTLRDVSVGLLSSLILQNVLPDKVPIGETCAACWLIPINIIKKIGGFNPLFFQYGEDNNYYQRICYYKIRNILVPHAHIYHDRGLVGNMLVYKAKQLRRDMLLVACNINLSVFRCLLKALRLLAKCYVYDLPKHMYKPGTYLRDVVWIFCHLHSIAGSRRKEKRNKCCWLYE